MRTDGSLERFDELDLAANNPQAVNAAQITRGRVRSGQNAVSSLRDFYSLIEEALKLHQTYFVREEERPWTLCFPFARPESLREGMEIRNTTKGVVYDVENVRIGSNGRPTGVVVLRGSLTPDTYDRLTFADENYVRFVSGFPRSNSQSFQFDEDHNLKEDPAPWVDTITYLLDRREPASSDRKPFSTVTEGKKRHRYEFPDPMDEGKTIQVFGQRWDNLIQFDTWSKTMEGARELVDWFVTFMDIWTGVLKWNGVQEILYWQQMSDRLATRWRNDIVNHSVQYYVRTETLWQSTYRVLNEAFVMLSREPADPTGIPHVQPFTGSPTFEVAESTVPTGL